MKIAMNSCSFVVGLIFFKSLLLLLTSVWGWAFNPRMFSNNLSSSFTRIRLSFHYYFLSFSLWLAQCPPRYVGTGVGLTAHTSFSLMPPLSFSLFPSANCTKIGLVFVDDTFNPLFTGASLDCSFSVLPIITPPFLHHCVSPHSYRVLFPSFHHFMN